MLLLPHDVSLNILNNIVYKMDEFLHYAFTNFTEI